MKHNETGLQRGDKGKTAFDKPREGNASKVKAEAMNWAETVIIYGTDNILFDVVVRSIIAGISGVMAAAVSVALSQVASVMLSIITGSSIGLVAIIIAPLILGEGSVTAIVRSVISMVVLAAIIGSFWGIIAKGIGYDNLTIGSCALIGGISALAINALFLIYIIYCRLSKVRDD